MEFITVVVFVVIAIASLAQKLQEAQKAGRERRAEKNKSNPGEVHPNVRRQLFEGSPSANVAKAKGAIERVTKASGIAAETTGRELITALFGVDAADSDDGWEEVHPVHRPVPKQAVQNVPKHNDPEHARQAALKQREQMEHQRSRAHAQHGSHAKTEAGRVEAEEKKRRQVMAERERRKKQAITQRQQASQARRKRKTQTSRPAAIVAPISRGGLIPRNLGDVRRAIVMAEILGKPKAFE